MLLRRIKASRQPEQVFLCFDNGQILPFPVDDVSRLHLVPGQDISNTLFFSIANIVLEHLLLKFALRQIAISPKTERILNFKLHLQLKKIIQRYHLTVSSSGDLINEVISYLHSRQLLNEADYVSHIINKCSHRSLFYIRSRLATAGVDIDNCQPLLQDRDDRSVLSHLVNRRLTDLADPKAKTRLIAKLMRKGFAFRDVKFVIDDLRQNR